MPSIAITAIVLGTLGVVLTAVFVAAIAGLVRYFAGSVLNAEWPLGTLAVNIVGSFIAGTAVGITGSYHTIVVLAGLGALTSVSAVAGEVATMISDARNRAAAIYLTTTVIAVVLGAWLGLQLSATPS